MNCVVCGNFTKQIKIDTYECSLCGHIFRDFRGDSIKFHKEIYRSKDHKNWKRDLKEINSDGNITNFFHKARKTIVESRLSVIKPFLNNKKNCFDIGSGAGTFVNELREQTNIKDIECLELADNLVKESRRLGFTTHQKSFLEFSTDRAFDLVTCYHVLEHVKDLDLFITRLNKIAKNMVVFEVPTLYCNFGKTNKKRNWRPPNDGSYDGHHHYFTIKSLTKLFEKHYRIVSIESGTQAPAILLIGVKK